MGQGIKLQRITRTLDAMAPHLTPSKKVVIYELHCQGKLNKAIAERYQHHPSTIENIIKNMEQHHNPYYVNPGRVLS